MYYRVSYLNIILSYKCAYFHLSSTNATGACRCCLSVRRNCTSILFSRCATGPGRRAATRLGSVARDHFHDVRFNIRVYCHILFCVIVSTNAIGERRDYRRAPQDFTLIHVSKFATGLTILIVRTVEVATREY